MLSSCTVNQKQNINSLNILPRREKEACNEVFIAIDSGNDADDRRQIKLIAYQQMRTEARISSIFSSWKYSGISDHIKIEQLTVRRKARMLFNYFIELKRETVLRQQAVRYHSRKLYRKFMMVCAYLLQVRYKGLYCQEYVKIRRFRSIISELNYNHQLNSLEDSHRNSQARSIHHNNLKYKVVRNWKKHVKSEKCCREQTRLAELKHELTLKNKAWLMLIRNQMERC